MFIAFCFFTIQNVGLVTSVTASVPTPTVSTAAISGAGGLVKDGAGTTTLSFANTYTGGTTISAGTVAISNGASFGSSTVTFASNGTTVAALASVRVLVPAVRLVPKLRRLRRQTVTRCCFHRLVR